MITNNQRTRYSYRSRLMALPVLALVFCSIALYAQRSANSVTTVFRPGFVDKPITVVIDAGHGGIDGGAYSIDGKVKEKDLALEISRKIQQLAASYNVNVVMTRTDDNLPGGKTVIHDGLKARTEITEKAKADLFIAIHMSSTDPKNPDPTKSGIEIYVPNKENERTNQSKQLASAVAQQLSTLYTTDPALKQRAQNLWVLEQTSCPALLIECGFITNDKDLAYFSNSVNQEAVAKKILEGIVSFKSKPAAAMTTPATNAQTVAMPAQVKKPTAPIVKMTTTHPASAQTTATTNATQPISTAETTDPIISKIEAYYCRNARYPQRALTQHAEGVVYFSIAFDQNGDIYYVQTFDQLPAGAKQINKLTTRSLVPAEEVTSTEQLSKQEMQQVLHQEVQRAFSRKPKLADARPQSSEYFFQVTFSLEKKKAPTA